MSLPQAINTLEDILTYGVPSEPPVRYHSIKLAIEALYAIIKAREGNYASFKLPLPGETKEKGRNKTRSNFT